MTEHRRLPFLSILCLLLVSLSATACGTLEIGIEMEIPPPASTRDPGMASGIMPPQTPTPTPRDYVPPTPGPAYTPVPAGEFPAPAGLSVAFARDGQMWLWRADDKETLPLVSFGQDGSDVRLSDDGQIVAFRRGLELWMVQSDGTGERPLVSSEDLEALTPAHQVTTVHRFEWVPGTHRLAFNTRLRTSTGSVLNDDLRLVDADTGVHTPLLSPEEGGEFYYSPDGLQIAVVTPGKISLVNADGTNRRDGILIHTPVATHSEDEFYAQPAWAADGSALRVAIPPPDPQARLGGQTTIWHIPTDGQPATLVSSVETAPSIDPNLLAFSHDLRFVAYAQLRGDSARWTEGAELWLEVRRLENDDVQAYVDAQALYGWAPDSRRFAFVSGRQQSYLRIGQWSGPTLPGSVDAGTPVDDIRWVDAEHYLLVARRNAALGAEGDRWDLLLANIEGSSTVLASSNEFPQYDLTVVEQPVRVALPTPAPPPSATLTPLAAPRIAAGQEIRPSPTPVAPLLGLVYQQAGRLWTDVGLERNSLFHRADGQLSADGNLVLYREKNGQDHDLWLADLISGDQHNLTNTADRIEDSPRWWPARPDLVLFASWPLKSPAGIGESGFLSTVGTDGSGYRVLDERHPIGGPPAPSPDGQTIAYGSGRTAWLYHWQTGPQAFDPAVYGLEEASALEMGNPAWSPDGTRLAWIVGGALPEGNGFGWGVAVFDLEQRTADLLYRHSEPAAGDGWPPAPAWSPDSQWLAFEMWGHGQDQSGIWVARADGSGNGATRLGDGHPVWSLDGRSLAFSGTAQGMPGHWLAWAGTWSLNAMDLAPSAQIVDWIPPRPSPAPSSYCELSPLQVPIVVPGAPTRSMVCLEYADPDSGNVARIYDYGMDVGSVAPGDEVTFTWSAEGGDMMLLEIYDGGVVAQAKEYGAHSLPLLAVYDHLPLSGSQAITMPADLVGGVRAVFWVADGEPAGSDAWNYERLAYAVLDLPRRDR